MFLYGHVIKYSVCRPCVGKELVTNFTRTNGFYKTHSYYAEDYQNGIEFGLRNMLVYTKFCCFFLLTAVCCSAINCTALFDSKIVNGSTAIPGEFPYMVRLRGSKLSSS